MTQEKKLEEISMSMYLKKSDDTSSWTEDFLVIDVCYIPKESTAPAILNFQSGFASKCLEKIFHNQDMHESRQRTGKKRRTHSDGRLSKCTILSTGEHAKAA